MEIRVKRISDATTEADGIRVLVDRYWPRGVRRDGATLDLWASEVAPTPEAIAAFGHKPERWDEFKTRYALELAKGPKRLMAERLAATASRGTLTLIYGGRDQKHNYAEVLAEVVRGIRVSGTVDPIAPAPERLATADRYTLRPHRNFESLNWLWTVFALSIPVVLLVWGELALRYGLPVIAVSGMLLAALVVASIVQAVRRDRDMLASQLAGSSLPKEDRQHVLVGFGSLLVQMFGVVIGLIALGLLPEGLFLLSHAI